MFSRRESELKSGLMSNEADSSTPTGEVGVNTVHLSKVCFLEHFAHPAQSTNGSLLSF